MPIAPLFFVMPNSIAQDSSPALQRQTIQIDQEFRAEAESIVDDLEEGVTTLKGTVTAWYGKTELRCRNLVIDRVNETAVATGEVWLKDLDGEFRAASFELDWSSDSKTGRANQVSLQIGYVNIQADSIETHPELWTLTQATFSLDDTDGNRNKIVARTVDIVPGKRGIARHVFVSVLGQRIGPIPTYSFNLDNRVSGFKIPSITNRQGLGIGVTWDSSFLIGSNSAIGADVSVFPKVAPSYSLSYTKSFLGGSVNATKLEVLDELGERFRDGWFNNIGIGDPESEWYSIGQARKSLTIKSSWNSGTSGRMPDASSISRPIDIGYEFSDKLGALSYRFDGHLQRVRPSASQPWSDRAVVGGTVLLPPVSLGQDWNTTQRIDIGVLASDKNQFSFARAELGLVSPDFDGIRIGAAYVRGFEFGSPDFDFDRLGLAHGAFLRMDYARGPYTLRYIWKYDLDSRTWYDREWEIALAAGPFEPFILRREFPQDYRFGVRFRLDDFVQRLQGRSRADFN